MEELNVALENAEKEQNKKYTLWTCVNNVEEIRMLAEETIQYAGTLYSSMKKLNADEIWEVVPRIVSDVMVEIFKVIDAKKEKGKSISTKIGDFMECIIEYAGTVDADKEGTFNPTIIVGPELQYDNDNPKNNELPTTEPLFEPAEQTTMDFVCKNVQMKLKTKYGIIAEDYKMIEYIFTSFLRKVKQYLVQHRDDADYGCMFYVGEAMTFGLNKYDTNDGVKCDIGINPGRIIKCEYAKSDEKSEKTSNE